VLNTPREELINNADLEEQTVDDVLAVLRAEFDDAAEDEEETPATEEAPADEEAPAADEDAAADTHE
jgi:N utilization substance protein A